MEIDAEEDGLVTIVMLDELAEFMSFREFRAEVESRERIIVVPQSVKCFTDNGFGEMVIMTRPVFLKRNGCWRNY